MRFAVCGPLLTTAETLFRVGLVNVGRVALHRLRARGGWYRLRVPLGKPYDGPFFRGPIDVRAIRISRSASAFWTSSANQVLSGHTPAFSHRWCAVGFPPRWNTSVLSRAVWRQSTPHWSELSEFELDEDIKGFWELSRFDGFLILALGWLSSGDVRCLAGLEQWIADWVRNNPANAGVHWLCAQETSIRLIQTLLAAELLLAYGGVEPAPALARFATEHARRIVPTMGYATAQDNNHGTSEAVALYVAGTWLAQTSPASSSRARFWRKLGRRHLEQRVARLVMPDGSFAQHSVNYHRLVLDMLSLAEWWRRRRGDVPFSDTFYDRARAATAWLYAVTDRRSGDAPNLGGNDGARVAVLHSLPYRDFRPSVQVASALFMASCLYPPGSWDEPLTWLGLSVPFEAPTAAASTLFPYGGYAKLVCGEGWALLRLPEYRFRPSHADALHLDVWHRGENVIRDGGSFSYNSGTTWLDYFSGTASHSTVQFDGRDQMPRLSRFLFGAWLRCRGLECSEHLVRAGYEDSFGAIHFRTVERDDSGFRIHDEISGFRERAVLRWRLAPGRWRLDGRHVRSEPGRPTISCEGPLRRVELVEGWESRHYGERTTVPVLEVEVAPQQGAEIRTVVRLDS